MTKHICDRCGKEINNTLEGLTNTVFPVYWITVQQSPITMPRSIDLRTECMSIVRAQLSKLLQGE